MRRHLEPGPDHPVTIEQKHTPVCITLAGESVLEARQHLELRESSYAPVIYIPRDQIDMTHLERSDHTTWCPYKGEASYYHLRTANGAISENAVWTYETPFPAIADIGDALAVYPDRVDAIKIG